MSAFILVTPPKVVNGEHDLLRDMLARGLPRLHVRKPGLSQSQLAEYLEAIPREYRHRVVLHQCHDYVASYRLGGRHFREADTPDGLLPALPGTATTSISLHVPDQLLTCKGAVDYCFLAPIYESISKAGHAPSPALQDRESLAGFLALSRYPVVALGGVTPSHFDELAGLGFAGAALLGFVWEAADPVQACIQALERARETLWNDAGALSCNRVP